AGRMGSSARSNGFQADGRRGVGGDWLDEHLERRGKPEPLPDSSPDAGLYAFALRVRIGCHDSDGSDGCQPAQGHTRFQYQVATFRMVLAERGEDGGLLLG